MGRGPPLFSDTEPRSGCDSERGFAFEPPRLGGGQVSRAQRIKAGQTGPLPALELGRDRTRARLNSSSASRAGAMLPLRADFSASALRQAKAGKERRLTKSPTYFCRTGGDVRPDLDTVKSLASRRPLFGRVQFSLGSQGSSDASVLADVFDAARSRAPSTRDQFSPSLKSKNSPSGSCFFRSSIRRSQFAGA